MNNTGEGGGSSAVEGGVQSFEEDCDTKSKLFHNTPCKRQSPQLGKKSTHASGLTNSGTSSALLVGRQKGTSSDTSSTDKESVGHRQLIEDFILYGYHNTWFDDEGLGTFYEITNTNGTVLYYAGTLCNGNGGPACDIDLEAGTYVWRVFGALDPHRANVSWSFCDVHGGAMSSVEFVISQDKKCIVEKWLQATEDLAIEETLVKYVTLVGSFHLGGMATASLSDKDVSILESVIAREMNLYSTHATNGAGSVTVTAWKPLNLPVTTQESKAETTSSQKVVTGVGRALSTEYAPQAPSLNAIDHITFKAKVDPSHLSVDFSNKKDVAQMVSSFKTRLATSMDNGNFVVKVVNHAKSIGASNMVTAKYAKFLTLELIHEMEVNEPITIMANGVIALSVLGGVLFGVLLFQYHRSRNSQEHRKNNGKISNILDVSVSETSVHAIPNTGIRLSTIHDTFSNTEKGHGCATSVLL